MLAIALLAAGGLTYEVALTRLLSALLVNSWVAPVLATALLGIGLGGALAAVMPALRTVAAARTGAGLAAVFAVASLPAWLLAVSVGMPLLGLVLVVAANAGLGAGSAAILSWLPARAARLLRADYAAAALAAVVTPWLLGQLGLGPLGVGMLAATLAALAAVALGSGAHQAGSTAISAAVSQGPTLHATLATAAAVCAPVLGFVALAVGTLAVDPASHMAAKPIALALARGGVIETTRWDATARTDLVRTPDGARYLYMDGGAGSLVPTPDPADWAHDVGAIAFLLEPASSAFLIGTGGGLDVAQARAAGVETIVAAEVNQDSVALVQRLGEAAGSVYAAPTEVVIGDGRRALATRDVRSDGAFDVITLAHVVTGAAELRGAALTESLVYTVEAFREYLDHLTPEGRLVLKLYDELTLTRALTTAVTALVESGVAASEASAAGHLLAVLDASTVPSIPVLVVKRSPFTLEQSVAAARAAEARGWGLLLIPGLLAPPSLRPLVEGSAGLPELIAASPDVDLVPTRDAAPHFFSFEPGVPGAVRLAGGVAGALLVVLILVALTRGRSAAGDGAAAGAGVGAGAGGAMGTVSGLLVAAVLLGCGFLLVELAALPIVQRSVGHPAWSLSVTLGAVLTGAALGSQLAARSLSRDPRVPALVAALTVAAWVVTAPLLSDVLMRANAALAGLVLGALLLVAAVPMGMPFPHVLASLGRPVLVATALALSGVAAVAAGAGALWLSHAVGNPAVGWAAAGAYLLAGMVASRRTSRPG